MSSFPDQLSWRMDACAVLFCSAMVTRSFRELPKGEDLSALWKWCCGHGTTFGIVVREQAGLSQRGQDFATNLRRHGAVSAKVTRWPGTELLPLSDRAIETILQLTVDVGPWLLPLLVDTADSLAEWQKPNLPEDPFFLRSDGSVLLGSVIHEGDAFLTLSETERHNLTATAPNIDAKLRK